MFDDINDTLGAFDITIKQAGFKVEPMKFSKGTDLEELRRERVAQRKKDDFEYAVKELVDNLDIPYDYEDEDLMLFVAKIVEATGGEMPFTICTLCGSQDDWHYNNNAECS